MDTTFNVGDVVKVHQKITESEKVKGASKSKKDVTEEQKERIQVFEGRVLAIKGYGDNKMFTVRKMSVGKVAVERTWPVNCPSIAKIEVVLKGDFRRAKLYYLRNRINKQQTPDAK